MKLAKTNQQEIYNLMKILCEVEGLYKELKHTNFEDIDFSDFDIMSNFDKRDSTTFLNYLVRYISTIHYQRILWNCSTLLDNCADPDLSHLDFNKDIKAGLELLEKERTKLNKVKNVPTHFHSFIIKGVTNLKTDKQGWRIVGLWGDEEKGEGNRIGPYFEYGDLKKCEDLIQELESRYGMPVAIDTLVAHFSMKETE